MTENRKMKFALILAVITVVITAIITASLYFYKYKPYMHQHKDCFQGNREPHIQLGMTAEEVKAILGASRILNNSNTLWRFDLGNGQSIVVWINQEVEGVNGYMYVDTDAFSGS